MKRFALVLLLLSIACRPAVEKGETPAVPPPPSPPLTETVSGTSAPPSVRPGAEPERNITITGVEMGNPLVITGLARTFENNVVLRARAMDGAAITEGFTTATGEMGQFSPYRGTLWLTREPGARVILEALEYSAKDGSETNLTRTEQAFDIVPVEATLYFPDQACTGVKPYVRRIPKSISMARLLAEALVRGPLKQERGATNPFPEGSAVQSVVLRDGTLTVDFNERLQNAGGSCRAQMIRAAVTETMSRLPAVKKVVLTAGGSEKLALQP